MKMGSIMEKCVVSSCLAGIKCRYNATDKKNDYVCSLVEKGIGIPMCPEVLGGLSVPREASEIVDDKVITRSGKDVTSNFESGALKVLEFCKNNNIKKAILTDKSPSCGLGRYDGTFSGKLIDKPGITATLLIENNIEVISSNDIKESK